MPLKDESIETLIDLLEIKLSCMEVYDRDDAREVARLERCRQELFILAGREPPTPVPVIALSQRSRGRPRMTA